MKKNWIFLLLILFSITAYAQSNRLYYSLVLEYDKGEIVKKDLFLIEAPEQDYKNQLGEGYVLMLKSFNGEELFSMKFNFPLKKINDAPLDWFNKEGEQIIVPNATDKELQKSSVALSIPYFKNGKTIKIYDIKNNLKLNVDISDFATCNLNRVCDLKESHELCPEDCLFAEEKIKVSWWQRIINFIKNMIKK